MSDKIPRLRLVLSREYEFSHEPSIAAKKTFDHVLRRRSRAKTQAQRDDLDLRLDVLVAEENDRHRMALPSKPPRPRKPGRPRWTEELFDARYAEALDLADSKSDADVAYHFRGTNAKGERGLEPGSIARLRQRRARGEFRTEAE